MFATDSFDRDAAEIEESVNEIAGHLDAQHARLSTTSPRCSATGACGTGRECGP
jgi:hypothetical protein